MFVKLFAAGTPTCDDVVCKELNPFSNRAGSTLGAIGRFAIGNLVTQVAELANARASAKFRATVDCAPDETRRAVTLVA
jgi:hypothetical protein